MEYRKLSELRKLENNPRTIKKEDMEMLVKSIRDNKDYFEARPLILSDRTGELVIIAGNQRYDASVTIGLDEVPTYLIKNLTEEREKEIIIRDNVSNGNWDWEELQDNWNTDELSDWGVDVPEKKEEGEGGEIQFTEELNESHNYVVLYFDNDVDWLQLMSVYPLSSVKALDSKKGFEKIGVGRVVDGKKFLNEILK